jgi:phosphohistidine phosphatase SixA
LSIDIEFRRHSIKDGPNPQMIGPDGYRLARAVGEQQLRGSRFTHFFASSYWRTHQTLAAFAEGAGDFELKYVPEHAPIYIMDEDVRKVWKACRTAELQGKDMVEAAFAFDEALAKKIANETASLFRDWVKNLPEGTRALVVGHSPSLELMWYGLFGEKIAGLAECQGFYIGVDGVRTMFSHGGPSHDPSEIRRSFETPRSYC